MTARTSSGLVAKSLPALRAGRAGCGGATCRPGTGRLGGGAGAGATIGCGATGIGARATLDAGADTGLAGACARRRTLETTLPMTPMKSRTIQTRNPTSRTDGYLCDGPPKGGGCWESLEPSLDAPIEERISVSACRLRKR